MSNAAYTGDPHAGGMLRCVELTDGAERGMRVIEVRTPAGLDVEILPDRALDIGRVAFHGRPVSWNSPTGYRHPAYWNGVDENGIALMRGMTGLVVTAGLDHIFSGDEVDGSRFGYPARERIHQPLHGRISATPASEFRFWREPDRFVVEGAMRQVAIFGEAFELRRRIEVTTGEPVIRIVDLVTNIGFTPTPHHLLYHINFGWPLLSEASRFVADVNDIVWATRNLDRQYALDRFPAPSPDFVEQCVQATLAVDDDGTSGVAIENDVDGRRVDVRWSAESLPCFVQWINGRSGVYSVALEPCSHGVVELEEGTGLPHLLEPGERRQYQVEFRFSTLEG